MGRVVEHHHVQGGLEFCLHTCVVQVVLQPTLSSLVVELPSARDEEQQVVPEHRTWPSINYIPHGIGLQ